MKAPAVPIAVLRDLRVVPADSGSADVVHFYCAWDVGDRARIASCRAKLAPHIRGEPCFFQIGPLPSMTREDWIDRVLSDLAQERGGG
jgi:hypothetical protein